MLTIWLWLLAATSALPAQDAASGPEPFSLRVVTTGLDNPWEMLWGPDGRIWVTERSGKRVVRVDPATGQTTVAATIPDVMQTHSQDGLLGLALHQDLLKSPASNLVYVALTYDADPGPVQLRRLKIRRYRYDAGTGTLGSPEDLVDGLPAGEDHVSGRLVFGQDQKLYLTVGDGGLNQFGRYCQPIRSQELPSAAEVQRKDWQHYQGKVLRINLDGTIPADNPTFASVRSHVFTTGHRNAQGLVVAPDGQIYASEHGPSMDDELNLIQSGKNYGWPYVAGYKDDRAYVYADWSRSSPEPCASLKWDAVVAPPSVPQQKESAWTDPGFTPPLQTFFTVDSTYNFATGNATIAPSGIDVYANRNGIPGWANSVLVTGLSRGTVYRVKLAADGRSVVGPPLGYFKSRDRYRDVLVGPDGRTIYTVTDATSPEHKGAILAFTYQSAGQ